MKKLLLLNVVFVCIIQSMLKHTLKKQTYIADDLCDIYLIKKNTPSLPPKLGIRPAIFYFIYYSAEMISSAEVKVQLISLSNID